MSFNFGCSCGACLRQQAEYTLIGMRLASGLAQVTWFILGVSKMNEDLLGMIHSLTTALLTAQSSLAFALQRPTADEGMQAVKMLVDDMKPVVEAAMIAVDSLTATNKPIPAGGSYEPSCGSTPGSCGSESPLKAEPIE